MCIRDRDKTLNIIKALLEDHTLARRTTFSVNGSLELLTVCIRSAYFWHKDCFLHPERGLTDEFISVMFRLIYKWNGLKTVYVTNASINLNYG